LDAEGGTSSISHYSEDKIKIAEVYNWSEVVRFKDRLFRMPAEQVPFGTFVHDNLGEYYNLATKAVCGDNETPSQPEYGKINQLIIVHVREWRDYSRRTGKTVLFIAWDDNERAETGFTKKHLAFTPGIQKILPGLVDVIGYLSVGESRPPYTRVLNFAPSPKTVSKFRRPRDAQALKIPYDIPFGLDNMPMPDILATIKEGTDWPSNKYKAPERKPAANAASAASAASAGTDTGVSA